MRQGYAKVDTTYKYFDGTAWGTSSHNALRRLTRKKVYSYSQFSENILEELDGEGDWKVVPEESLSRLSGFEQGHVYQATPYETTEHERCWNVTFLRVGDECLVQFGIAKDKAIMTDFELKMTDKLFRLFQKRVESIGGIVEDGTIVLSDLQTAAADAEGLRQELEKLLELAEQLNASASPDGESVMQMERWRDQAVTLQDRYTKARRDVRQAVEQLLKDKGRSDEKAQAQALLLALPESSAVIGIDALLASVIVARAHALAVGNVGVLTDPKMAFLSTVLQGIYRGVPTVHITFDDHERVTLKLTKYSGSLTFTPSGIE